MNLQRKMAAHRYSTIKVLKDLAKLKTESDVIVVIRFDADVQGDVEDKERQQRERICWFWLIIGCMACL